MAYYNQNQTASTNAQGMNEKKEDEQAAGQPVQLSNGASPMAATNAPAAPTNAPVKPASSGMAAGFQAFQKANQGAATNKLANAATTNVQNLGQSATTSINQAVNKFGQKVDAGSLANRQQALQDVSNAVTAARQIAAPPKPVAPAAPAPLVNTGLTPEQAALNAQMGGKNPTPEQTATNAASFNKPVAAPIIAPAPTIDQAQQDRFKEVINSKYVGPESLRQAGLYNPAAEKAKLANTAVTNAGTAQGREELLRSMYEKRGDYNRGLNKLDTSLLNSSQAGVQGLQTAAKNVGNVSAQLDKAQLGSGNLAQNRTQEIQNIQNQARDTFTQGKQAEEAATEERLASVVKDWDKLPEHFREAIRSQSKGQVNLGSAEADILGIQSGEGLYKLGADAIKTTNAEKDRLISRDEQARQSALASLAGLDQSKRLDTSLKYNNADRAGTQTAMDALDVAGTRANLNAAEKGFQDFAEGADVTGYGVKKNKTSGKRYYSEAKANLGDLLKQSGYEFGNTDKPNTANPNMMDSLSKVTQQTGDEDVFSGISEGLMSPYQDNRNVGQTVAQGFVDYSTAGILPGMRALGMDTSFADTSKWFGGGANSGQSKAIAKTQAQQDLEKKVQETVDTSGFANRFAVNDNEATKSRTAALQQLLQKLDKTNA